MVGFVGARMEVVDGMHVEQSQRSRMSGDGGAHPECEVIH